MLFELHRRIPSVRPPFMQRGETLDLRNAAPAARSAAAAECDPAGAALGKR